MSDEAEQELVEHRCIPHAQHEDSEGPLGSSRAAPINMHAEHGRPAHESADPPSQSNELTQEHRAFSTRDARTAILDGGALPVHNRFEPLSESNPHSQSQAEPTSHAAGSVKPSCRQATQEVPVLLAIPVASWNIGGCSTASAVQAITRAEVTKPKIVCFQEMPRREVGWHTSTEDTYSVVQYRHDDQQWRGNAVAFTADFQVIRRRGCRFGIWL